MVGSLRKVFYGLLLSFTLTACATVNEHHALKSQLDAPVITAFQGSLLVFSPKHRFQVLIEWSADVNQGHARLTHPASGRVVELRWQGEVLSMRENQASGRLWKHIKLEQLYDMGIVLPPWVLAKVLHRQIPPSLHPQGHDVWQGKMNDSVIQLRWQNDYHRLTMTDITHGRKAILRMD